MHVEKWVMERGGVVVMCTLDKLARFESDHCMVKLTWVWGNVKWEGMVHPGEKWC